MKKVFIAVALVATMGLALISCNKDENKCWKVTYTTATYGAYTTYQWCSENNMEAQVDQWKKMGYTDIDYKTASSYKNIVDCEAANIQK